MLTSSSALPSARPRALSRRSFLAALTLALATAACAHAEEEPAPGPATPVDPDPSTDPGAPADIADPGVLEALTQTPEFLARRIPFLDTPAYDEAVHVTMSDGVRLAVSIYYPPGFDRAAGKAPAVFIDTWYGRADEAIGDPIAMYRAAGLVVVLGDSRGFGASFGSQPGFMSPAARRDQVEMLAWIARQPWSNGRTVASGISLSATLAEFMASSGAASLKAAVIRNSDHDEYATNLFPGGVPNVNMLEGVDGFVTGARGEACVKELAACAALHVLSVDGDGDFALLRAALADHQANVDGAAPIKAEFKDDRVGAGTWAEISPAAQIEALGRARVPARITASWIDGMTATGALDRFTRLPDAPMEVVIGVADHMGGMDGDPFARTPFGVARPTAEESFRADVDFIGRALEGAPIGHSVRYFVMGAGVWKTSQVWPPAGTRQQLVRFSATGLVADDAVAPAAETTYVVDPTASSGAYNRWASQRAGGVYYADRRTAKGRRFVLDGAPMVHDTELVGAPELCLALRTDQPDGIVVAYLEDIAPDGRVTHLTEGELRLIHRKTQGPACDPAPGTSRSFARADAAAVTPGELMRLEIPLMPTAALIRTGHRLRVSLAGADAGTFPMLTTVPATWTVATGGAEGSTIILPLRDWR